MPSLDDIYRTRLFKTAIFLGAIGVLLAPLAGRSSMALQADRISGVRPVDSQTPSQKRAAETVAIDRDPFVAPAADQEKAQGVPSSASGVVGMIVHQGDPIGYAVPGPSIDQPAAIVVRAIVSGSNPSALVEENGKPHVVQIGDALGGSAISEIDRHGITLRDGRHLAIDQSDR